MKSLKKFTLALIVVLLVMFFVTCEAELPVEEDEVEYTDVEYSNDGANVTIWLDGSKPVPVRKSDRAMQGALAQMSYDFIEVIFIGGGTTVRTSWELGQPAGISGVARNAATGINYGPLTASCMFVGKKDGKTLLGVGKLTNAVPNMTGSGPPPATQVNQATKSVTFTISPLTTGLVIESEAPTETVPIRDAIFDSFDYVAAGSPSPTGYTTRVGHSALSALSDGVSYPTYSLSPTSTHITLANYKFTFKAGDSSAGSGFETSDIIGAIKNYGGAYKPTVQRRTPRYMENGHYMEPRSHVDTKTRVYISGTGYATTGTLPAALVLDELTAGSAFVPTVPLVFVTGTQTGIFSFFLEIPVLMLSNAAGASGSTAAERWYIRTGMGSDLYSLDDGAGSGGCVLMGVGVTSTDWLEIDWTWL